MTKNFNANHISTWELPSIKRQKKFLSFGDNASLKFLFIHPIYDLTSSIFKARQVMYFVKYCFEVMAKDSFHVSWRRLSASFVVSITGVFRKSALGWSLEKRQIGKIRREPNNRPSCYVAVAYCLCLICFVRVVSNVVGVQ